MRRLSFIVLLALLIAAAPVCAGAAGVTSVELVERPGEWDGRTITFTGEAIGEAMVRGDEVWLHLNDDAYADRTVDEGGALSGYNSGHAVVANTELASAVTVFGDHRHRGDLVEVTGIFNAACPEHGGDMDIHVEGLRVMRPGVAVEDEPEPGKLAVLTITLLLAALAGLGLRYRGSRV